MGEYIWILSADMALHLNEARGVSSTYILPKAHSQIDPAELVGGRIWMILRTTRGDSLFACIYVDMIEQFEDGFNTGDFLLSTDLAKSYRCAASYSSGITNFRTDKTSALSFGLHVADGATFVALSSQATNTIAIKLKKPSPAIWGRTKTQYTQKIAFFGAKSALAAITGRFALEDIWAGSRPKLPPFANFAYAALLSTYGEPISEELKGDLSRLDPTIIQTAVSEDANTLRVLHRKPTVDINLLPIEPDRIYARKFIARCQNPIDLADIVEKVEHAEKRHQDILRDISTHLKTMNFLPLQSTSLDLFVSTLHGFSIFEIKTATPLNILSQAAKGIFQLGCYKNALQEAGYDNCNLALVMEATGASELESYATNILHSFDIKVLFYNHSKSWPGRLKGLEDLIGSSGEEH